MRSNQPRTTIDVVPVRGAELRLRVLNDLAELPLPDALDSPPDFDVVVAAGDVTTSAVDTIRRLREAFPAPMPIVIVLGDREYSRSDRVVTIARAREVARTCGVVLLEDGHAIVDGVRYVGATFWSDYRLHGSDVASIERGFAAASDLFRSLGIVERQRHVMDPYAATWAHCHSLVRLNEVLQVPHDGPTVIVTHHAPSRLSLSPAARDDPLAPSMASPRDQFVQSSGAVLWVHGHVPTPSDYVLGATRVVGSPRQTVSVSWTSAARDRGQNG